MEVTPKLPRKSLSLTSRLRNRSSASPSPKNRLKNSIGPPSSPVAIPNVNAVVDGTPPQRKFSFSVPYSPTNDADFSPCSRLSQSSNNSPDVTWRWNQDDQSTENSSNATTKSTPNSTNIRELRKKRSLERKEELRKAEMEKRKAIQSKREDVIKKQCEEMELLISKKCSASSKSSDDFAEKKSQVSESPTCFLDDKEDSDLFNDSAFDGVLESLQKDLEKKQLTPENKQHEIENKKENESPGFVDKDLNLLLDDSDSEGLLLEASQQVEVTIESQLKRSCTKELERDFEEIPAVCKDNDKATTSNYDFLQDSFDDYFALVDDDFLATEAKKPRTSLQRYKSLPTDSPNAKTHTKAAGDSSKNETENGKFKRYPSSTTIRPNNKFH